MEDKQLIKAINHKTKAKSILLREMKKTINNIMKADKTEKLSEKSNDALSKMYINLDMELSEIQKLIDIFKK